MSGIHHRLERPTPKSRHEINDKKPFTKEKHMFWNRKPEIRVGPIGLTALPPVPPKKAFSAMYEMLKDAEKYDNSGDQLPCMRILEALRESIENYINKPDKE